MKRILSLTLSASLALALLCGCSSPDAVVTMTAIYTDPTEAVQSAELPTPVPEPTHHPEETNHLVETHHPEPEPTHHMTPESTHHSENDHYGTAKPVPTSAPAPAAGASVDLAAFYQSILAGDEEFGANMELTGEYLDELYPGLTSIAVRQRMIYQPMISSVVCEIALVEVENSSDAAAVADVFQARVDYQVGTEDSPGGAWYPASIEGWQNDSRIVSHGNYVMLIAYDKCDSIVASFNALF